MFPLIQTAVTIIGAGFLFVTGVVVTDNYLTPEPDPTPTEVVTPEPLPEAEATSIATSTEPVEDLATSTEALPEPDPTPTEVVPEPLPEADPMVPDDLPLPELSTATETIATTTPVAEPIVETFDDIIEITEEKDCFDGNLRDVFMNPGMCLRELRMRI